MVQRSANGGTTCLLAACTDAHVSLYVHAEECHLHIHETFTQKALREDVQAMFHDVLEIPWAVTEVTENAQTDFMLSDDHTCMKASGAVIAPLRKFFTAVAFDIDYDSSVHSPKMNRLARDLHMLKIPAIISGEGEKVVLHTFIRDALSPVSNFQTIKHMGITLYRTSWTDCAATGYIPSKMTPVLRSHTNKWIVDGDLITDHTRGGCVRVHITSLLPTHASIAVCGYPLHKTIGRKEWQPQREFFDERSGSAESVLIDIYDGGRCSFIVKTTNALYIIKERFDIESLTYIDNTLCLVGYVVSKKPIIP